MPEAVIPQNQIKALESGLKKLKEAKLLHLSEVKEMYKAIATHHNEVRLAHLTGKPKDILEQAKQDTKFFYILSTMLAEVTLCEHKDQKTHVKQVFNWYQANKHTLHSGPRFGRNSVAEKRRSILKSPMLDESLPPSRENSNLINMNCNEKESFSRPQSGNSMQVRFSSKKDQKRDSEISSQQPEPIENLLPKRKAHPLSHLYNPHAQNLGGEAHSESSYGSRGSTSGFMRIRMGGGDDSSRSEAMRKWDAYLQEHNYGQDNLTKLQHMGRSGVAGSVRYSAHDRGMDAEAMTGNVIAGYTETQAHSKPQKQPITADPKNLLHEQTLEDFYENTEGHYPVQKPKYPSFRSTSAPPRQPLQETQNTRLGSAKSTVSVPPIGLNSPALKNRDVWTGDENFGSNVKMNTMMGMIDMVTEELTGHKEVLAPTPAPGFRQPTVAVDPNERPTTAPSMGAIARPSSPDPLLENEGGQQPMTAPASSSHAVSDLDSLRSGSALDSAIDWRGSVSPVGHKTKKQAAMFGDHSYVQKQPRAISCHQTGRQLSTPQPQPPRPKTAPFYPFEDEIMPWELNERPDVAASHTTMEIDADAMAQMLQVQHLGGSHGRRRGRRYYSNYCNYLYEDVKDTDDQYSQPPNLEYLSFISQMPVARSQATSDSGYRALDSGLDSLGESLHLPPECDAVAPADDNESQDMDMADMNDLDDYDEDGGWVEEGHQADYTSTTEGGVPDEFAESRKIIDEISSIINNGQETSSAVNNSDSNILDKDVYLECGQKNEENTVIDDPDTICLGDKRLEDIHVQNTQQERPSTRQSVKEVKFDDNVTIKEVSSRDQPAGDSVIGIQFRAYDPSLMVESGNKTLIVKPKLQSTPAIKPGQILTQEQVKTQVLSQLNREKKPVKPGHLRSHGPTFSTEDTNSLHTITPGLPEGMPQGPVAPIISPRPPQKERLFRRSFQKQEEPASDSEDINELSALSITGTSRKKQAPKSAQESGDTKTDPSQQDSKGFKGKKMRSRSAGTSPVPARTMDHHKMLLRQQEMLKKAPAVPYRTPPSIPTPHGLHGGRKSGYTAFSKEHESHARKDRSPRHYMEKVGVLRKENESEAEKNADEPFSVSLCITSLRVNSDTYRGKGTSPELWPQAPTPVTSLEEDRGSYQGMDADEYLQNWKTRVNLQEAVRNSQPEEKQRFIEIGRPIPEIVDLKDPDKYAEAVQKQKEAAAAVNIQKLFRGYMARQNYRYLTAEERHRREDLQKEILEKQRAHAEHMRRLQEIESRKVPYPETLEWQREVKSKQDFYQFKREVKAAEYAEELEKENAELEAYKEHIGPHANIYDNFHPKKTGLDKKVLNSAATCIQRWLRGWLVRLRFLKFARKTKALSSNMGAFVKQYRDLMKKVQGQHGTGKVGVTFDFDEMTKFMDNKRRYEGVFERKSFAGQLEREELEKFFKDCDLHPSESELEDAIHIVMRGRGKGSSADNFNKADVMDLLYYLFPPDGSGVPNRRKSTWIRPIVDGLDKSNIKDSDNLEPTDFKPVWNLVASSNRERKLKEQELEQQNKAAEHKKFIEEQTQKMQARKSSVNQPCEDDNNVTKKDQHNEKSGDDLNQTVTSGHNCSRRKKPEMKPVPSFDIIGEEDEEEEA